MSGVYSVSYTHLDVYKRQRDDIVTEDYSVLFNTLQKDPANNQREALEYIYRQLRNTEPPDKETALQIIDKLFFSDKKYDLGEVGRYKINKKLGRDTVDINQRVLKMCIRDSSCLILKQVLLLWM